MARPGACRKEIQTMAFPSRKQMFSMYRLTVLFATALTLWAQTSTQPATEDKRILGIFTNDRTTDDSPILSNLTPREKLAIAFGDATDRAIFVQTALISGIGQATNANPSFGQGIEGYAKRFGTAYADFAVENMMTEGIFPTLLHQDPRYFRRRVGNNAGRYVEQLGFDAASNVLNVRSAEAASRVGG
jgi:hypothetical protein